MECVSAVVELVNELVKIVRSVCSWAGRQLDYHRHLERHMQELNTEVGRLDGRKRDVVAGIGRRVNNLEACRDWVGRVDTIIAEVLSIEIKVKEVKWWKRAGLGGTVCAKKVKVRKLYDEGSAFVAEVSGEGNLAIGVNAMGDGAIIENRNGGENDVEIKQFEKNKGSNGNIALGVAAMGKDAKVVNDGSLNKVRIGNIKING